MLLEKPVISHGYVTKENRIINTMQYFIVHWVQKLNAVNTFGYCFVDHIFVVVAVRTIKGVSVIPLSNKCQYMLEMN